MKKIILTLLAFTLTLSSFAEISTKIFENKTIYKIEKEVTEIKFLVTFKDNLNGYILKTNTFEENKEFKNYSNIINKKIVNSNFDECKVSVTVSGGFGSNFISVTVERTVDCKVWLAELKKIKAEIQAELGL